MIIDYLAPIYSGDYAEYQTASFHNGQISVVVSQTAEVGDDVAEGDIVLVGDDLVLREVLCDLESFSLRCSIAQGDL